MARVFEHEVTVAELRAVLDQLEPEDRLVPNDVKNLALYRGRDYIGVVDLYDGARVELWDEPGVNDAPA